MVVVFQAKIAMIFMKNNQKFAMMMLNKVADNLCKRVRPNQNEKYRKSRHFLEQIQKALD